MILHLSSTAYFYINCITGYNKYGDIFFTAVNYPIATIANTPIAHSESDYHQIKDLGYLLFFKVGDKHCYAPG
jgi:hypothetical protein